MAPRTLCCNAYTWKNIFSTKYKLSRTKNNCVHAQLGQIMNNKIPKDKKAPLALLKSWAEKQGAGSKSRGLGMPLHSAPTKQWASHPNHPSGWTPGPAPTLTPHKEPAHHLNSGSGQGQLTALVLAAPCCSRGPNKAFPEFLFWPLINFY